MSETNYWKRLNRRRFLARTGAGAFAGSMVLAGACGGDDDDEGLFAQQKGA